MMLIEALKKLNVIEKKIEKNKELISKYASQTSVERPYFEFQEDEIKSLFQSCIDLKDEYISLHTRIAKTNLDTVVLVDGVSYTIHSLLLHKRKLAKLMRQVYDMADDRTANDRLSTMFRRGSSDDNITIVRYYNEKDKQEKIRYWSDLYHSIDSRLEIVNATTELVE